MEARRDEERRGEARHREIEEVGRGAEVGLLVPNHSQVQRLQREPSLGWVIDSGNT